MRDIVVDDHIPCITGTNNIAFVQCRENEMWVMLLEKAWAKANGTYGKTIAGVTAESLKAMTGAPTIQHRHDQLSADELWHIVKEADDNKYVMACAVGAEDY